MNTKIKGGKVKNSLLLGVAFNDSEQPITRTGKDGNRVCCPFYNRWKFMLRRCYKYDYRAYENCTVCNEWLYFTNFKAWMETQDWQGKHLDKDLLVAGNKIYGPDTCVFIDQKINKFIIEKTQRKYNYPTGTFMLKTGKFRARCYEVTTGKCKHLGVYDTSEEAHQVYLNFKFEQACILAAEQKDELVAKALIDRYKTMIDDQVRLK